MNDQMNNPMKDFKDSLFKAFSFFNYELFNNMLSYCDIQVVQQGEQVQGVYYPEKYTPKDDIEDVNKVDVIALNPVSFTRDEKYILSTLVHEMAHQYESEHGTPGKNGYHNRSWADTMKNIGLYPSSTGEPGGKETGRNMSHYIIEGGIFDDACDRFIEENNFSIDWFVVAPVKKPKTSRKRTYRCECDQPWYSNLSGRKAVCSECGSEFIEDEI